MSRYRPRKPAELLTALREAGVNLTSPQTQSLLGLVPPPTEDTCRACGKPIRMMIYRGSGYCSQQCEWARP